MARQHRADAPGAVHHVMIRGVDGRWIFEGDAHREDFTRRFGLLARELRFIVLAWCLLDNHAHFVVQTGREPLALLMARLTSRHARRLNRSIDRVGHLFQDRYKAIRIDTDARLAQDVAYTLGNPVRHGLLTMHQLGSYPGSGYGALVGTRPPRDFESPEATAAAMGLDRTRAGAFISKIALDPGSNGAALEPDQISELNRLIRDRCRLHGVPEASLRSRDPRVRPVQSEICALAGKVLDIPISEIARHIGLPAWTARRIRRRVSIGV